MVDRSSAVEDTDITSAPPRDPWWQVALALLTILGVVAGIGVAWRSIAESGDSPAERYMPLSHGLSLSYRITGPDQSSSFQSQNVARESGINALNLLDVPIQVAIASAVTGTPAEQIDSNRYGEFLRNDAARVTIARVVSTDLTQDGASDTTELLLWVRPQQIDLLSIAGQPLSPPAPIFDGALTVGGEQTTTGIAGSTSVPYTATLTLEAVEPVTTPAGQFDDCRRVLFTLSVGAAPFTSRSWYCPGIGVAQQETTQPDQEGATRAALIGASTPRLTGVTEVAPTLAPIVAPPAAAPSAPTDELVQVWSFRETGQNTHITTPPVTTADLLIYGTQNGGLLAIDRATHQQRWRFQAGGAIVGAPTISGGMVIVGSADRRVYAVDLRSGAFRWAFLTRDAIAGSPAVADGRVYVGSEDRTLYALDQELGREQWRFVAGDAIASSPLVEGSSIYIGSDDGVLYALDAGSGALRWAFATEGAITARPLLYQSTLYVGSQDGTLYALDADTERRDGEQIWSYDSSEAIVADLASDGETIYVTNGGDEVHAVAQLSGERRWRYASPTTLYGSPWLRGQRVLVNRGRELLSLDAASGAEQPPIPTGDPASYHSLRGDGLELFVGHRSGFMQVLGPPRAEAAAGELIWQASDLASDLFDKTDSLATPLLPAGDGTDRLLAVSVVGRIYALDAADGDMTMLGQLESLNVVLTPPAVAPGALLIADASGQLVAFDLAERRERWRASTVGNLLSAPLVAGDRVLISTVEEKTVRAYAFDLGSGAPIWEREFPSPFGFGSSSGLAGGHLLIVAGHIIALDPADGEVAWQTPDTFGALQLTIDQQRVYAVGIESEQAVVLVWDAATGKELRRAQIEIESPPNLLGGMAASGDLVALALNDRSLLLIDLAARETRWRISTAAAVFGLPVIDGDVLRLITSDNHLLGYRMGDGELLSDFAIQGAGGEQAISSMTPLVVGDRLYAAFYQTAFALRVR